MMLRSSLLCRRWAAPLAMLLAVLLMSAEARAERPPAEKLLPRATFGYLSIADVPDLSERFGNTSIGLMSEDPEMKPFVKAMYGVLADLVDTVQEQIALSLPEILDLFQGELTVAVVSPKTGNPAVVVFVDAGEQMPNMKKILAKGTGALDGIAEVKRTETTIGDTTLIVYESTEDADAPQAAYFIKEETIVMASNAEVLEQVLAAWNGEAEEGTTLAENAKYAAIMRRCRGAGGEEPQVTWFFDPLTMIEHFAREDTGPRIMLAMLPTLGLDGLSGLGGSFFFDAGPYDSVIHWHILLGTPRRGILKMIALSSGDAAPQTWVPADVSMYATLHIDVDTFFPTLNELYDGFRSEGAFSRLLAGSVKEESGVDFEGAVVPQLDGRVTMIQWIERPVTLASQATMLGFTLKDSEPIAATLAALAKKFPEQLEKETFGGETYYVFNPPGLQSARERAREQPGQPEPPMPCIGVVDDTLLMANRTAIFEQAILANRDSSKSLASSPDFEVVAERIRRQASGTNPTMIMFSRPTEGMRFLYGLANGDAARQGLRGAAAENEFFKSLDTALEKHPLPEFSVVERYMAPTGALMVDDETGLHYMGFGMRPEKK
ncbi:MAG: hypothetical protein HQ581_28900 [Planctomycetes bacterium]|nr:hypothetical protein [Planctomycetota bacterium]